MKTDRENIFDKMGADPNLDFQMLWQLQKNGGEEELFSENAIDKDFTIKTSMDWNSLRRIANKDTELEKTWKLFGRLSAFQLAAFGAIGVVTAPLFVLITYNWGVNKILSGNGLSIVLGITVIAAIAGLAVMLITVPLYIYLANKKPSGKNRKQPRIKDYAMLCSFAIAACLVFLFFDLSNNISEATTDKPLSYQSGVKPVNINGSTKLITEEYYVLLTKHPEKLNIQYTTKQSGDTILTNKDPNYLNAVALKLEGKGENFQAQLVYSLAEKLNPASLHNPYQTNFLLDVYAAGKDKSVIYLPTLKRFVYSDYAACFSGEQTQCGWLDTLIRTNNASITNYELLNLKALGFEKMGKSDSALHIYQFAWDNKRADVITLLNTRKIAEDLPVQSLINMTGTAK